MGDPFYANHCPRARLSLEAERITVMGFAVAIPMTLAATIQLTWQVLSRMAPLIGFPVVDSFNRPDSFPGRRPSSPVAVYAPGVCIPQNTGPGRILLTSGHLDVDRFWNIFLFLTDRCQLFIVERRLKFT